MITNNKLFIIFIIIEKDCNRAKFLINEHFRRLIKKKKTILINF